MSLFENAVVWVVVVVVVVSITIVVGGVVVVLDGFCSAALLLSLALLR